MHLCIDAGNTRIKYAVFDNQKIIQRLYSDDFDSDFIENILSKYKPGKTIISSVKEIPNKVITIFEKDNNLIILTNKVSIPIKLDYKTPESLGTDRIAVSVGACKLFPGKNNLVINAGTCITYDIVTGKGIYKGGAISPGIEMRYKAMHEFTSKLPYVTNRKAIRITGKSTEESLNSGVLNNTCFEIEGAIRFYSSHFKKLNVLLTGGDSSFLAKRLKKGIFAAPDLVLTGLNEILLHNA